MMQTHRNVFLVASALSVILLIVSYILKDNGGAYEICLALLGSSVIGAFLELLNYKNAKRTLIMEIIADNDIISNYMNDALWIYENVEDIRKKLDVLVELYEKTQNHIFVLARELYAPFYPKGKLIDTIEENATVIVSVYDLLLSLHRRIILLDIEVSRRVCPERNRWINWKRQDMAYDEATLSLINEKINLLMKDENKLVRFNKFYRKYYKLVGAKKVKSHTETMSEIEEDFDIKLRKVNEDAVTHTIIKGNSMKRKNHKKVNVEETAIQEYLDIVKSEYGFERERKQSIETRASAILALLGAICLFYLQNIDIKTTFSLMSLPLTFEALIKIVSGLTMIGAFIFTFVAILKTLSAKEYDRFEVKNLNIEFLIQNREDGILKAIDAYKKVIIQNRELNENKSKYYSKSLYGALFLIVSTIVYAII